MTVLDQNTSPTCFLIFFALFGVIWNSIHVIILVENIGDLVDLHPWTQVDALIVSITFTSVIWLIGNAMLVGIAIKVYRGYREHTAIMQEGQTFVKPDIADQHPMITQIPTICSKCEYVLPVTGLEWLSAESFRCPNCGSEQRIGRTYD